MYGAGRDGGARLHGSMARWSVDAAFIHRACLVLCLSCLVSSYARPASRWRSGFFSASPRLVVRQ